MTDEALAQLKQKERELWARMDAEEAVFKKTRSEWAAISDRLNEENNRRKFFELFQAELAGAQEQAVSRLTKAANIGAALAGGTTTLAECTKEGA